MMHDNWCACGVLTDTQPKYHYYQYHECIYHNYESCGLCSHMAATLVTVTEGYLWSAVNQVNE